jgi:hypothetical protein
MEGGPFDDNLFSDFSGCGTGTSALLSAKAHADSRGNVHSIQVMLGLQHSDMMLGVPSMGTAGGKMDGACHQQTHHMGTQHHDIGPLFSQPTSTPTDQHLASATAANTKRKSEDGGVTTNLQHEGECFGSAPRNKSITCDLLSTIHININVWQTHI